MSDQNACTQKGREVALHLVCTYVQYMSPRTLCTKFSAQTEHSGSKVAISVPRLEAALISQSWPEHMFIDGFPDISLNRPEHRTKET